MFSEVSLLLRQPPYLLCAPQQEESDGCLLACVHLSAAEGESASGPSREFVSFMRASGRAARARDQLGHFAPPVAPKKANRKFSFNRKT